MKGRFFVVLGIVMSAMMAGCITTSGIDSGSVAVQNRDMKAVIVFGDQDREKIRRYYAERKKGKSMPPGLAKREELPPGLQRHIQKHNELPPGLEGERLPYELERSLTRLPENYVRVKIGTDVVLMNERTRVVVDVIGNVE